MKRTTIVGFLLLATTPAFAQEADDSSRVAGSVRAGAEYDDNVFRADGDTRDGGFLSRYFGTLDLEHSWSRTAVAANLTHGGKFFFEDSQGEVADTLLSEGSASLRHRVWKPLGLWSQASLRDRTERQGSRDYTTGGLGGGVDTYLGPVSLRLGGAARYFAFKPNPELSSANVEGLSNLSARMGDDFSAYLGYTVARRAFLTDRLVLDEDDFPVAAVGEPRRDLFHGSRIGVGYHGKVVADLNYGYLVNTSNSNGFGLVRHEINLTATAPLPWRLFASLHIELQRTDYELRGATTAVDEDDRNAIVASLARAIGEHWEIEARYSLYLQEFGAESPYRRQLIFLAGAYLFD